MTKPVIYTIGHSNLALADFLARLRAFAIDTVVDVRSQPVSRYSPWFNRAELTAALKQAAIRYAFLGESLGGRPHDSAYYDPDGHVRYDRWAASAPFQRGLAQLAQAATKYRLALLCAEADPAHCHRHLLIARALAERGWSQARILHIRDDEHCQPDDAIAAQADLFGADGWRSPQSVLHKVRPSASSSD